MIGALINLIGGPIANSVTDVIKTKINRDMSDTEMRAEVAKAVAGALETIPDAQASVLIAEAQGHGWLQRSWRPLTGAMLGFVIIFWALIVPIAVDWLGFPPIRIGDKLLEWVMTALISFGTVYAGGRTLEKIADRVTAGWRKS